MGKNNCFLESNCNDIDSISIAMAYVPWQHWENIYEADLGLKQGTIFKDLDKPYTSGCGRGGRK